MIGTHQISSVMIDIGWYVRDYIEFDQSKLLQDSKYITSIYMNIVNREYLNYNLYFIFTILKTMKAQQHAEWRLFDDTIYMWPWDNGKINLRLTKWDHVRYGKNENNEINFPWEYDIVGTTIKCLEADDALHYTIITDDKKVVILQKAAALEVTTFDAVDLWICTDASIKKEIEALEMKGDIMVLWEEVAAE